VATERLPAASFAWRLPVSGPWRRASCAGRDETMRG
jgi:hypothetical protein